MARVRLIQESLRGPHKEWKVLVVCALLNQTSGAQVRPMWRELLDRWPTPRALAAARRETLENMLRPLGLYRRRARLLKRLSSDVAGGKERGEVHGVGQYALDACAIFVDGRTNLRPRDKKLGPYVAWLRSRGRSATRRRAPAT